MTPQAVAAIYGGLVGGVLAMIGVLAGMALERRLQSRGKLRCIVSDWDLTDVGSLGKAFCSFEVYLFNERILATGLRDVSVVFYRDGEQGWGYLLKDRASSESLRVINLPPRQWVHVRPYALFEGNVVQELTGLRQVVLVGHLPDGSEFRQRILAREDFVATRSEPVSPRKDYSRPWWRRMLGR
ncbi:MAG: hypothetical protein ACRDM3_04725 [Rubrobacteraceae bacterium]